MNVQRPFAAAGWFLVLALSGCDDSRPARALSHSENAAKAPSACDLAYGDTGNGNSTITTSVDPQLQFGEPGVMFLTFTTDAARDDAHARLRSVAGLEELVPGLTLKAYRNLPIVAFNAPRITPELVTALKAAFPPSQGLMGIWGNKELRYFHAETRPLTGVESVHTQLDVTGRGVGVGVIDAGVDGSAYPAEDGTLLTDFEHLALNVQIVSTSDIVDGVGGYMTVQNPLNNTATTSGHGTHVAGTVAGTGARYRPEDHPRGKYRGMAPDATLVAAATNAAILVLYAVEAWDFMLDAEVRGPHNIRVVNNSYGTSGGDFAAGNPVMVAARRAYELGIIPVFAAGNDRNEIGNTCLGTAEVEDSTSPYSRSPCTIGVGASDKDGRTLACYSSIGTADDPASWPDIIAPGTGVISNNALLTPDGPGALAEGNDGPPGAYTSNSGTSMATPHISGILALMLEVNPELTRDSALDLLQSGARPLVFTSADFYFQDGDPGANKPYPAYQQGAGLVDALFSVTAARNLFLGEITRLVEQVLDEWADTLDPALHDPVLGEPIVEASKTRDLAVPANSAELVVSIEWDVPQDMDLYVYGPDGKLAGSGTNFVNTGEITVISAPVAGVYKIEVRGFINGPNPYRGKATVQRRVVVSS